MHHQLVSDRRLRNDFIPAARMVPDITPQACARISFPTSFTSISADVSALLRPGARINLHFELWEQPIKTEPSFSAAAYKAAVLA